MEFDPKISIKEMASYRRPVTFSHCLYMMQARSFAYTCTPAALVFALRGKSVASRHPLPPSSCVGVLREASWPQPHSVTMHFFGLATTGQPEIFLN